MTSGDRHARLRELFDRAVGLAGEEREAFLESACDGDPLLEAELRELLREDDEPTLELLRHPVLDQGAEEPALPRVGRYTLLEVLGEGGMGTVYLAQQEEPVSRRVALKMLHIGLGGERARMRFDLERQALAEMSHPAIAQIYDGGVSETGRPYFVMEYVPGESVTAYCDRRRATVRQRLQLFCRVCDGVQHAHMRGIIHRDIKPSNILVTEQEGQARPKLIDFGIARMSAHAQASRPFETAHGQVLGTVLYMSPEQADGREVEIDTRTDVYSLGVVLYELLTGTLPLPADELRKKGMAAIREALQKRIPARPSTRLNEADTDTAEIADSRGLAPRELVRRVAGDLDWITMRALEKDRQRRYEMASSLREDIERYLEGRPVEARPPSLGYRVKRFVLRHRVVVSLGVLLGLAIASGFATSLLGWRAAASARRQAVLEAERADAVVEFLNLVLFQADGGTQAEETPLSVLLERAESDLSGRFEGRPGDAIEVHMQMGVAYLMLGDVESAHRHYQVAYNLCGQTSDNPEQSFLTVVSLSHTTRLLHGRRAAEAFAGQIARSALAVVRAHSRRRARALESLWAATTEPDLPAAEIERRLSLASSAVLAAVREGSPDALIGAWLTAHAGANIHRPDNQPPLRDFLVPLQQATREETARHLLLLVVFMASAEVSLLPGEEDYGVAKGFAMEYEHLADAQLPAGHWMRADARRLLGVAMAGESPENPDVQRQAEERVLDAWSWSWEVDVDEPPERLREIRRGPVQLLELWGRSERLESFLQDSLTRSEAARPPRFWWMLAQTGASQEVYAAALRALAQEGSADEGLRGAALLRAGRAQEASAVLRAAVAEGDSRPETRLFLQLARAATGDTSAQVDEVRMPADASPLQRALLHELEASRPGR